MKALTVLTALITLTGCTQFNAFVDSYGAQAARQALTVAHYTQCVATPIGAIREKYDTPEKLKAYNDFCNVQSTFTLEAEQ